MTMTSEPKPGPPIDAKAAARSFAHLHCHSHYSLLDGAAKIEDLVGQAKKLGMTALALTDHGNLYGAIEFHEKCTAAGIKPIIGYEAYVAPAHRTDRTTRGGNGGEAAFHLTLLAQNLAGFHNLIKLASFAFLEGFYYKPRIDRELLERYAEGIIVLSGCAASEFSNEILAGRLEEAQKTAEWFARVFQDRFYIEIQDNGLAIQKECAAGAIAIASRLSLPLVATCDSHYLCAADAEAHEVLLCINTGRTINDPKRLQYGSDQFYLKSPAEMYAAFPEHADAVARSQEIADRVELELDFKQRHFPVFAPPAGKTDKEYLRELCEAGIERRYGPAAAARPEIRERLELELSVIEKLGFASYFLIVWDFVNFANERGIPCGARGSACGAIVSYLLGFSNVDPIEYDLLFERFLDPSRAEAPDIDVDFCQNRRDEVIRFVREKYGEKNVAQIITFNTMAARAALRDVGRALEIPLARVDQIAKMVPQVLKITLAEALEQSADLRREYDNDAQIRRLVDVAKRLEGLARNPGVHAAGVVIADKPLIEYIPLQKSNDIITTQWEMAILEKVGMLKVDFLGLRNLTLLTEAVAMIKRVRGIELDLNSLPLDDPKTYGLLQRGETKGVFQLESEGIRNLLVRMKPDKFEDIIATNALYRPGPLEGGMVDTYIRVKHGLERPHYVHPVMKEVLGETYSVMVYQEQVMRILNRLGGIELAAAYKCIKAISKKNYEAIAKNRTQFVEGAKKQGLTQAQAEEIFGLIEHFAGYGFNKSHSTAYALVAYQTAYLKAHYPAEFMAALLSSEADKTDVLVDHIDDCKRMKLKVMPPDVNESGLGFTVSGDVIRFGLAAIKGVGEKAVEAIVAEQEANGRYKNLFDFCTRLPLKLVTKSTLESLIKTGAFDSFGAKRSQLWHILPSAMQAGLTAQNARDAGQGLLFDEDSYADASGEPVPMPLPDIPEWPDKERLAYEKSLLGIYLSSHPLAEHEKELKTFRSHTIKELAAFSGQAIEVIVGGMIGGVRTLLQQRGRNANQSYARFTLEDETGSIACVMFADVYAQYGGLIVNDGIGLLRAEIDTTRAEEISLIANEWIPLEKASERLAGALLVKLNSHQHRPDAIDLLASVLKASPGPAPVLLEIVAEDGLRTRMRAGDAFRVTCDFELVGKITAAIGEGVAHLVPLPANGASAVKSPRTNGARRGRRG